MSIREKEERRRDKRLELTLFGHFTLENHAGDYPCCTENVSATGLFLRGFPAGSVGGLVVAHLDQLGRVEGTIVRSEDGWFAFEIAAAPATMKKIATRVESLAVGVLPLSWAKASNIVSLEQARASAKVKAAAAAQKFLPPRTINERIDWLTESAEFNFEVILNLMGRIETLEARIQLCETGGARL